AAVVNQVEFHVAPAPVELESAFALAVGHVAAALDDGCVRVDEGLADAAAEGKTLREAEFVQVIEKQAANAARLLPVRQIEIFIAPLLVLGIKCIAERRAGCLCGLMPSDRILAKAVVGGQVEATAKPPYGR